MARGQPAHILAAVASAPGSTTHGFAPDHHSTLLVPIGNRHRRHWTGPNCSAACHHAQVQAHTRRGRRLPAAHQAAHRDTAPTTGTDQSSPGSPTDLPTSHLHGIRREHCCRPDQRRSHPNGQPNGVRPATDRASRRPTCRSFPCIRCKSSSHLRGPGSVASGRHNLPARQGRTHAGMDDDHGLWPDSPSSSPTPGWAPAGRHTPEYQGAHA